MKILIVDDELSSRQLLKAILEPYGEIQTAEDGIEALHAFEDCGEKAFDLILLDILMPGIDGHELLSRIRMIERARGIFGFGSVKVLMITVVDDPGSVQRAFQSNCVGYLVKPVTGESLKFEMRQLGLI